MRRCSRSSSSQVQWDSVQSLGCSGKETSEEEQHAGNTRKYIHQAFTQLQCMVLETEFCYPAWVDKAILCFGLRDVKGEIILTCQKM